MGCLFTAATAENKRERAGVSVKREKERERLLYLGFYLGKCEKHYKGNVCACFFEKLTQPPFLAQLTRLNN